MKRRLLSRTMSGQPGERHNTGLAAIALLLLSLCGCTVGPDFRHPAPPDAKGYGRDGFPAATAATDVPGGEAQRFVSGMDIPGQWWTLFHSDSLNQLITRALQRNSDLRAAEAALRAAHENVLAQQGASYPTVAASFSPSTNKTPLAALAPVGNTNSAYYSLYTSQLSVAYAPDVFGLNRRIVESLQAQEENQRFQVEATYLTLTSNLVSAVIQEASLRGQLGATQEIVREENQALELIRQEKTLGQVTGADVAAQETLLAQAKATLPPLQKQIELQRDLLTALIGDLPSNETAAQFELSTLTLPQDLPVTLPAELVQQRPDIRAAEANMHTASAAVGVAIANRLPNITLGAALGSSAPTIGQSFSPGTGFWTLAGELIQPIFDAGILRHKERATEALFEQSEAQYQSTVVTAFQNVADALRALNRDAELVQAAAEAEHAATVSLNLARGQHQLGDISRLTLLNAEQNEQQTRLSLVQAQGSRYLDTVALFQALGGGWWNRTDVAAQ